MAVDKRSFVAYTDWNETFKKLTDEEAGRLSKIIFAFVADENPKAPDRITELLFEPIKQHLKRDLKKYDEIKKRRSEAGRNGGLKSGETRSKAIEKEANEAIASKTQANEAVNVNGNVNGNDNVNVIPSTIVEGEEEKSAYSAEEEKLIINSFLEGQDLFKLKKEPQKKESNKTFAQSLKFESPQWLESVCIQQKKPPEKILEKIDEFLKYLKATEKEHPSRKEFISHFINWISAKFKEDIKKSSIPKFSINQ